MAAWSTLAASTCPLTSGQAGIAAIIAGVAARRSLPVRAVTIAYATALQESDLSNLPYGDRDSVGVFQQRPSQGWGTRRELLDPVYATERFFAALVDVPNYQHLLIYQAAQAVQHSADGQAYGQYAGQGAAMATGFTGQRPHDVWCWYGTGVSGPDRLAAAGKQLNRAFGKLAIGHVGRPPSAGARPQSGRGLGRRHLAGHPREQLRHQARELPGLPVDSSGRPEGLDHVHGQARELASVRDTRQH